jgi:hypothetical protein
VSKNPGKTRPQVGLARLSGAIYFAFVVIGAIGFLAVRPALFTEPTSIIAAFTDHPVLSGLSIAVELATVLLQAVLAWSLFTLFRPVDAANSTAVFVFGLVSASMIAAARLLVASPSTAPDAAADGTAQTLVLLSSSLWESGGLFFGLWLIPLGLLVLKSGWMPRALGWVLVVGGAGKIISSLLGPLLDSAPWISTALTLPQNVAEFWLVGYLLIFGVKPRKQNAVTPESPHLARS